MIYKVFPHASDLENLSRISTERSVEADNFDYSSVVVNKPWGYEYLWYQNPSIAVWMLHLKCDHSTSLHCHVRKRTSLIVMDGQAVCSTLEDRFRLSSMDVMVLEPGVFHRTQAISPEGAFVMEIETPVMKGDLVRLKDSFGRQGTGYERSSQYSQEFSKYEYRPCRDAAALDVAFRKIEFLFLNGKNSAPQQPPEKSLIVPTLKPWMDDDSMIADVAEAIPAQQVAHRFHLASQKNIELLYIQQKS